MDITVIIMLVIGAAVAAAGFILPENKGIKADSKREEEKFKKYVEEQLKEVKSQIEEAAEEMTQNASDKTERAMERLSNEKIAAVGDYSNSVLQEIHNNHEEVMFLYDMLNDKQTMLKNTAVEVTNLAKIAEEKAKDAKLTAEHMAETVQRAARTVEAIQNAAETLETLQKLQPISVAALIQDDTEREAKMDMAAPLQETGVEYGAHSVRADDNERLPDTEDDTKAGQDAAGASVMQAAAGKTVKRTVSPKKVTSSDGVGRKNDNIITEQAVMQESIRAGKSEEQAEAAEEEPAADVKAVQKKAVSGADKKSAVRKPRQAKAKTSISEASAGAERKKTAEAVQPSSEVQIQFASENGPMQNNNARILELHKSGRSNMAIAKELGLGIGEVKLVIDLFEGM